MMKLGEILTEIDSSKLLGSNTQEYWCIKLHNYGK
jgi:hypothetical protein